LQALDLPMFYEMRAEAHRYVSLILAHGGVPNYCLPDFFKNMLQPSVLREQYADMSAAELIEEWGWRASVQYFTDKPVLRFLTYGAQVAQDFVERCREMAWETLDQETVPSAEALGLPRRVVDAYRQWWAEQGADQMQRDVTDRWRLRKPALLVDPWGEGVLLDLPPQQVPATMVHAEIAWQVRVGEEPYATLPVHVRRSGFDLKTQAASLPLRRPAADYDVALLVDGQAKRTWRYPGIDDARPLLVFDPARGTLLSWTHSLPARLLGLLYPARYTLQIEGEARAVETLPRLPWGWAEFRGETWDLSQADGLHLTADGQVACTVDLRPDETVQRPHLVGGERLTVELPGDQAPVYVGPPPRVRVPLTARQELEEALARWRVRVRNKWPAAPEVAVHGTLADWLAGLTVTETHVDLPLHLPDLLGAAPCGNYEVRLRGPLGRDAELTLRAVPHCVICGHEPLYLPAASGDPPPVSLLVETAPGDSLTHQGEQAGCRVQLDAQDAAGWAYQVTVEPEATLAELTLVRPLPSGEAVRVPLPVPIRRLRWALSGEHAGATRREWTGRVLKRPVDALLQAQSPCLLVSLPWDQDGAAPPQISLRLLDVDQVEQQVAQGICPPRRRQLWRFDLVAFMDTLRASRSPILRFELVIAHLSGHEALLRLPVLSLTRTLVVENVELLWRPIDGDLALTFRWDEPLPLKNRHVRFWPLWRPWEPVLDRAIPDTARGEWSFEVPEGQLASGKYRLEFLVVDPWVSADPPLPPPQGAPGTVDTWLFDAAQRLLDMVNGIKQAGQTFDVLLELMFVLEEGVRRQGSKFKTAFEDLLDLSLPAEISTSPYAENFRQWCYENLDDGTIPQILALATLVETTKDQNILTPLRLKMFAPLRVKRLLESHERGQITPDQFDIYFTHLPKSALLPESACELLLTVPNERVRLQALQQLIRRKPQVGVETVLAWVNAARLSDDDAVALLWTNPNFTIKYVQAQRAASTWDPELQRTAQRLLETLKRSAKDAIRVGDWVRCDLGWGRIERIEDPEAGIQVNCCLEKHAAFKLVVTLHPSVEPETVIIDLASASASFAEPGMIMICSECKAFATQTSDLMAQHFKHAHPPRSKREAKNRGKGYARYHQVEDPNVELKTIEFSTQGPTDSQL
jgi:hypothetical protein